MIKFKNNKRIYTLCSISIAAALGLSACSSPKVENTNVSSEVPAKQEDVKKNTNNTSNNIKEEKKEASVSSTSSVKVPKFKKITLSKNEKPSFNTAWKSSQNKNYSACIEGKGTDAMEEGVGKVYIKDKDSSISSFELVSNSKLTPKYVEWLDDNQLFVIIGSAFGTVSKGGNLYLLNVDTGKVSVVFESNDEKQEIISVHRTGNNLSLKANVFDDDNFVKSHTENWLVKSFDVNLKSKMEVKNSEGKVVYTIN